MAQDTAAYIPGVCNINREEIAKRQKAGYFGTGLYIAVLVVLVTLALSRWYRIVLFLPAFIAAIGFLQARNHFCVGYGSAGLQNATEGNTTAQQIDDAAAVSADKKRSREMYIQAALIGIALTALGLSIPV